MRAIAFDFQMALSVVDSNWQGFLLFNEQRHYSGLFRGVNEYLTCGREVFQFNAKILLDRDKSRG
jgi:hypothetical protein